MCHCVLTYIYTHAICKSHACKNVQGSIILKMEIVRPPGNTAHLFHYYNGIKTEKKKTSIVLSVYGVWIGEQIY